MITMSMTARGRRSPLAFSLLLLLLLLLLLSCAVGRQFASISPSVQSSVTHSPSQPLNPNPRLHVSASLPSLPSSPSSPLLSTPLPPLTLLAPCALPPYPLPTSFAATAPHLRRSRSCCLPPVFTWQAPQRRIASPSP